MESKTYQENYNDTLAEARMMTVEELKQVLRDWLAYHPWAVQAYEKALAEKVGK
jgi:hypothetical protein